MVYVKRALGAVAALTIALVLNFVDMIRYVLAHGAFVGWNFAFSWGIRQPAIWAIWAIAVLLFLLFIKSSQLHSRALRVLLFWTPTLVGSTLALLATAVLAPLCVYAG
jgi:hypothetical protein